MLQVFKFLYSDLIFKGTSGDPHFYGFKGQKYDIMGQSYEIYNLITSSTLQINSRFVPYFRLPEQVVPTGTMMGELGKILITVFLMY